MRNLVIIFMLLSIISCKKSGDSKDNSNSNKDTIKPVITLVPPNSQIIDPDGKAYIDPGFSATDNIDGDIKSKVVITDDINTSKVGTYHRWYNVKDKAENAAVEQKREVKVIYTK